MIRTSSKYMGIGNGRVTAPPPTFKGGREKYHCSPPHFSSWTKNKNTILGLFIHWTLIDKGIFWNCSDKVHRPVAMGGGGYAGCVCSPPIRNSSKLPCKFDGPKHITRPSKCARLHHLKMKLSKLLLREGTPLPQPPHLAHKTSAFIHSPDDTPC